MPSSSESTHPRSKSPSALQRSSVSHSTRCSSTTAIVRRPKKSGCDVFDFLKYDFGYTWYIGYGLAIPLALAAALVGLALWRGWPRWITVFSVVVGIWALVGLFLINIAWG